MNPAELRMMWMSQYNPERMALDDAASFYGQPSVGLSVMDDITHQTSPVDLNPMMSIVGGEYSGQATTSLGAHSGAPTTLITAGANSDLYGISQVGALHPVLQTTAFPTYTKIIDNDDMDGDDSNQFVHQPYDQMTDSSCYDAIGNDNSTNALTHDNRELINIDDFVMMTDSNSYEDGQDSKDGHLIEENYVEQKPQAMTVRHKKTRKIEPVSRPGLVLKTPIAYKGNIDPSVIPIERDGMAVCERCGAIGVKHTFYTKARSFCSMACARELSALVCNDKSTTQSSALVHNNTGNNNSNERSRTGLELELRVSHFRNSNYRFKMNNTQINGENGLSEEIDQKPILYRDLLPQDEVPQIPKLDRLPSPCPQEDKILSVRRKAYDHLNSFDWTPELSKPNFFAAPVTCFSHAPGYDMWDNIGIEMKVEVENTDCDSQASIAPGQTPHSFWVATILNICGYKALMRYEGFDDSSHDFWVNLCSSEVHPVGWCATRGKPLIPPRSIENKYSDWKDFLVERLSGARTLPSNFYNKISDSFKSRFRCGLNLEIVDKNRISQVKLATVHKIVGKRLFVKYFDTPDDGFWCHEDSSIIHPVGWATTVGHNLSAPQDYLDRMLAGREQMIEVHEDDATIELFKMNFTFEEYYLEGKTNGFVEGMKLEAVDPLNLSSICVATVMAVLKFGYMMIRIDSYDPDATGADWFCYHEKSPSIFPVGFCESNDIALTPPNGYDVTNFSWEKYLLETASAPAAEHLFHRVVPNHGFEPGMRLECADLMDPRLVCVARISRIVGRLLKIRFDGWPDEYDQWLDVESPDIYPVGWCVLVGHKLEGPPLLTKAQQPVKTTPKTTRKKRKKKHKIENSVGVLRPQGRPPLNIKRENQDIVRSNNGTMDRVNVKLELKPEPHDEEDDDDEFEDDISRSDQSTPLPPTPEPGDKGSRSSLSGSTNSLNSVTKPASTSPAPPTERKATSYINNSTVTSSKYIPRLTDINSSPDQSTISATICGELIPDTWNIHDVSQFLRVNDCTAHCDTFSRNKIDGKRMLQLSKDEIITLLGMKVGPALKIFDLIQQLKCKVNPSKSRLLKANINKKFL